MASRLFVLRLRAIQRLDRWRLRRIARRHPGLHIDPSASSNLAVARFTLAPGAELHIGPDVVSERVPDGVRFVAAEGARIEIGAGTWLRGEVQPVHLVAYAGARITVGPEGFLNGCQLSAKQRVTLGTRSWVGMGTRVFDADQHALDAEHPEQVAPVTLGDHCWVASDVTVLRGVTIGAHAVIGTRSLVTRDVPPHTIAYGQPARPHGSVGDRSRTP